MVRTSIAVVHWTPRQTDRTGGIGWSMHTEVRALPPVDVSVTGTIDNAVPVSNVRRCVTPGACGTYVDAPVMHLNRPRDVRRWLQMYIDGTVPATGRAAVRHIDVPVPPPTKCILCAAFQPRTVLSLSGPQSQHPAAPKPTHATNVSTPERCRVGHRTTRDR